MSSLPVSYSLVGFPSRFALGSSGANTVVTFLLVHDSENWTYVIQGIDASARGPARRMRAWYQFPGQLKLVFAQEVENVPIPSPPARDSYIGQWRGALPLVAGEEVEFGIETEIFADLTICAWGITVPTFAGPIV